MDSLSRRALLTLIASALTGGCGESSGPRATLTLAPERFVVLVCQEFPLTATVSPATSAAVRFRSSNIATATVAPTGVVRGVRDGVAMIHAWIDADSTVRDSAEAAVTSPGPCATGDRPDLMANVR
jgi:uncharacterized protein YjdB